MLSALCAPAASARPRLRGCGPLISRLHRASLATQAAHSKPLVIGIRREDKNRWERRVALTPAHVKDLIAETGAQVIVQPSNTRIFNNASFVAAGATINEDLSHADAILGIKEVPIDKLIPSKTYVIFSHTHKGQKYNMPSLQAFLDKGIRLIDYELMVNQEGKRQVLFGKHAGYAGMIDGLHGLGQRLLALGYNSPFIHMGQAHVYPNLECVHTKLRHVADIIEDQGLPDAFAPMLFTFTGSGNVTQGARAIFDDLPHDNVTVDELPFIAKDRYNERYRRRLLALQVGAQDYVERIDGGPYNREEYREHPERYRSVFATKIAPYTSMLVNGIYWESKYPRLMTAKDLAHIQRQRELKTRMLAIADISCDIGGSLEFMSHASTIDSPFFYVDAVNGLEHKDIEKPGVQINSIDNLPTELPFEASKHFGDSLYPYAKALVTSNDLTEAKRIAYQFPNTVAAHLDVSDSAALDQLIKDSDVVVSLVPAHLHPRLADVAIRRGKHMVTASYISPEMQKLDQAARDAQVSIISEIGLDPGIDHCSAMKIIDEAKERGAKIRSFISWCGGLAAPENSNNQIGYKFSWSPRGVLTAGLNAAQFKANGQMREIPEGKLFENRFSSVPLYPGFAFEGLANRDSLQYADPYGLDLDTMDTMFRGTLRYSGYSEIMDCLLRLGLLSLDPKSHVSAASATEFLHRAIGMSKSSGDLRHFIAHRLALPTNDPLLDRLLLALEEFGMLSTDASPVTAATSLDAMSKILQNSLKLQTGERDLVCLFHEFGIENLDGSYDVQTSSLVAYGDAESGETAMARTVGIPAAIATRLLLEDAVTTRGVIRPTTKEIYEPLLKRLEGKGLVFAEHTKSGVHNSLQRRMKWT
ncbi:hypothetical protein GGI10_001078 [Coemansia sp. RSA 2530]|nr:hypothetical protein GGI10_001078 [Coemansia sp. RSA 2530]